MTGMPFLKKLPASYGEKIQLLSLGSGFIIPANLKLYYSPEKIPALTYAWQKDEAITLATPSYLLAYKNYDSSAVKVLAQAIYKNAANLKTKSKTWNLISEDQAKAEIQNKIPYHEGVRSYLGVK
jgi:TRAP-type uncharacterized transport system substrate-binding protein